MMDIAAKMETLSREDLLHFRQMGYLVLPRMLDNIRCDELLSFSRQQLEALTPPLEYEVDVRYPGSPIGQSGEGSKTVRRLLEAASRDPSLKNLGLDSPISAVIRELFGSEDETLMSQCHHNCIMTKDPGFSSDTLWHQDNRYWSFEEENLISAWIALGPENSGNGGLKVIPGSHGLDFESECFDKDLFFRTDLIKNKTLLKNCKQVELGKGDVLFFHSRLLHAADRNRSDETKVSLVFTYHLENNLPIKGSRSDGLPSLRVGAIPLAINAK